MRPFRRLPIAFRLKPEATFGLGITCRRLWLPPSPFDVAQGAPSGVEGQAEETQLSGQDADFYAMGGGKAFVEVLDEVLAGSEPAEPVHRPGPGLGYATPSILFFDAGLRRFPEPAAVVSPISRWVSSSERRSTPARPPRALSPQEQEALAAFVQLGAEIGDDFTHAELRSVFRSLALRYHPDRHPGSSAGEKARLSVSFAQLHAAYETLKSTPVSSH